LSSLRLFSIFSSFRPASKLWCAWGGLKPTSSPQLHESQSLASRRGLPGPIELGSSVNHGRDPSKPSPLRKSPPGSRIDLEPSFGLAPTSDDRRSPTSRRTRSNREHDLRPILPHAPCSHSLFPRPSNSIHDLAQNEPTRMILPTHPIAARPCGLKISVLMRSHWSKEQYDAWRHATMRAAMGFPLEVCPTYLVST
jgi:hypothetical protein